jgi:peptidoglycan/xylan/chitin deacetylase (PgdA/CDA1 family)
MRAVYAVELFLAYLMYFTGIYAWRRRHLQQRGARVVLVYHRLSAGPGGLGDMTSVRSFEWQMACVARCFSPVDWRAILDEKGSDRGIEVLVTFDDGYRDDFTRALPIIEKYRIPAVFFAVADLIFEKKRIERNDREKDEDIFPTTEELTAARRSSWITFGNHTTSHTIVARLNREVLEAELRDAQNAFEEHLGVTPEVFAYPRGRKGDFDSDIVSLLERIGIKAAFTMVPGLVDAKTPRYFIPRIGVSHVNDPVLFKVKMLGLLSGFVNMKNRLQR